MHCFEWYFRTRTKGKIVQRRVGGLLIKDFYWAVGILAGDIRPIDDWLRLGFWDPAAERLHGLTLERLRRDGLDVAASQAGRASARGNMSADVVNRRPMLPPIGVQILHVDSHSK